ncbi:hypothetical protein EMIT0215P_30409 [Pseudomonas serboccidentalis]
MAAPGTVSTLKQILYQRYTRHRQPIENKRQLKSGTAFALSFPTLTRASPLKKELPPWGISIKA